MNDTMVCVASEKLYGAEDVRRCVIWADSKPTNFPTNGVGVDGLADTARIAPFSLILCLAEGEIYSLNTVGTWVKWTPNA